MTASRKERERETEFGDKETEIRTQRQERDQRSERDTGRTTGRRRRGVVQIMCLRVAGTLPLACSKRTASASASSTRCSDASATPRASAAGAHGQAFAQRHSGHNGTEEGEDVQLQRHSGATGTGRRICGGREARRELTALHRQRRRKPLKLFALRVVSVWRQRLGEDVCPASEAHHDVERDGEEDLEEVVHHAEDLTRHNHQPSVTRAQTPQTPQTPQTAINQHMNC